MIKTIDSPVFAFIICFFKAILLLLYLRKEVLHDSKIFCINKLV